MSKHILSSCTTLPLCITLHSIPSCENVITPFCENVITGSNLNRNKDPHESSTSPRSNKTGHKQTDYFLFCCDPLHVIFQLTWKNESKVAVVTWRAGNTRAIIYEKFMITTWEDEFNPRIFLHLVGSYCKVA